MDAFSELRNFGLNSAIFVNKEAWNLLKSHRNLHIVALYWTMSQNSSRSSRAKGHKASEDMAEAGEGSPGECESGTAVSSLGPETESDAIAAVTRALDAMGKAEQRLESVRVNFEDEVKKMHTAMLESQSAIKAGANIIKSYENRLAKVEKVVESVKDIDKNVTELKEANARLAERNSILNASLVEANTRFSNFVQRPTPFEYKKTIVCLNVNMEVNETQESRVLIAKGILKIGLKMDPLPAIVDVARLPHNRDVQLTYTPGLKIEFETEEVRKGALRMAKNLRDGPLNQISIRRSMDEGERQQIAAYQQMERSLNTQGIVIPHMYPSGNIRRNRPQFNNNHIAPHIPTQHVASTVQHQRPAGAPSLLPDSASVAPRGFRQPVNVLERLTNSAGSE